MMRSTVSWKSRLASIGLAGGAALTAACGSSDGTDTTAQATTSASDDAGPTSPTNDAGGEGSSDPVPFVNGGCPVLGCGSLVDDGDGGRPFLLDGAVTTVDAAFPTIDSGGVAPDAG